jgi:hypothetical protein
VLVAHEYVCEYEEEGRKEEKEGVKRTRKSGGENDARVLKGEVCENGTSNECGVLKNDEDERW